MGHGSVDGSAARSGWVWIAILGVAAAVYGLGMSREGLWYDEAYSAAMAEYPMAEIVGRTRDDVHPPLYYLLLRGVRVTLGNSEFDLRLLSVAAAVGLVGLGAGPVRRLLGRSTACIYAAVALSTPAVLIYAHEARMYTFVMLAVTAGALYGCLAVRDGVRRDWVCLGVWTLAAAYLHYYGAVAAFQTYLFLGLWLVATKRKALKPLVITAGCVLLAYLPWLVYFAGQTRDVRSGFWIPAVDARLVLGALCVPFSYKDFYPGVPASVIAATCTALSLGVGGAMLLAVRRAWPMLAVSVLAGAVFVGTMLTAILISLTLVPVFFPRYMLACVGLLVVAVSLGISALPARSLRLAALGLLVLLNLPVLRDVYVRQFNGRMKEMASDFREKIEPSDLIVTLDSFCTGPSMYYFPGASHCFCVSDQEAPWQRTFKVFEPRLAYRQRLEELLSARTAFWLMSSHCEYSYDWAQFLKEVPGDWEQVMAPVQYSCSYCRYGFTLARFARAGRAELSPDAPKQPH